MNRRNNRSNRNIQIVEKNLIRCKSQMRPVYDTDTCKNYQAKMGAENDKICKNCKFSF